ncbi:ATP-binding cassette domain-containing protein [Nonomuraea sp. C10]|uniref:ABC transporter ATP-binding protein n=1 Tax=Nonomuraea sp. C10 TaxID=2600577 RepID=UPI0011CE7F30|nr:ATP-binding cassette domain-containing protein [Nonomuraea sp. C10]TXK42955.1 ATP-binding cassette domain-containing protein [Nonomuraea sp. C10]
MRLTDVSFRYRRRDPSVIREAAAELSPGDVVELTGANGAGKSTLLRLLAGLLRPTGGAITGRPAAVGLAPDRFPGEQPFTVSGYLDHMARVCGGRWRPWAERLNMEQLLGVRLRELSKGSAHKVGLAQALMAEPGLLLLDEPFAGLDSGTRDELPPIVAELSARGAIVVTADHQGGLRDLPSLRHWTITDGRLVETTPARTPVLAGKLAGTTPQGPAEDAVEGIAGEPAVTPDTTATTVGSPAGEAGGRAVGGSADGGVGVDRGGVAVEVTVPVGDLGAFLERMRGEGYPARPVSGEESR